LALKASLLSLLYLILSPFPSTFSLPPRSLFPSTFHNYFVLTSFFILLGIFFIYISNAIPKVPHTLPPTPLPTHSHFLDAEKAFDKIQHLFIIKDLETSGIGGLILSFLECLAEYGHTLRATFPYTSAAYISP
jgi:hypothetical protein